MTDRHIGNWTATFMVIANMIGTGVFTSLGFQVVGIRSGFPILLLWVLGGVGALCGALTYGELGTRLPRSGGEYHLLSRIYHPFLGFLAGWVSATVGFAAPTALAAMALATYLASVVPTLPVSHVAALTVISFTALHLWSIPWGNRITNLLTVVKVLLLMFFVGAGFTLVAGQPVSPWPAPGDLALIRSSDFAISLVFVAYSYTGWNAAIYIVGELKEPARLPRALVLGTLLVTVLYALVNYVFIYTVPFEELSGQLEVGYLSASRLFGSAGGAWMAILIATVLTSTVSVMVFVGPRIVQVMGEDMGLLRFLSHRNARGIPTAAILLQLVMTLFFIYSSTFDRVLLYAGFTLSLTTALTVSGVFLLRWQDKRGRGPAAGTARGGFKMPGYPIVPLVFLALSAWSLIYMLRDRRAESLMGLLTMAIGGVIYGANALWWKQTPGSPE